MNQPNPSEIDPHHIYLTDFTKHFYALNMISLGYGLFIDTYIIQHLEELQDVHNKLVRGEKMNEIPKVVGEMTFRALLDSIKICICFENFLKVKLLFNDVIIHKIKKDETRPHLVKLAKEQSKRPIRTDEALNEIDILSRIDEILHHNTIDMSWILRPQYRKYYGIDDKVLDHLKDISEKRNRLHFYASGKLSVSQNIIDMHRELIKVAKCDMAVYQNVIFDRLNPAQVNRLKPICD